MRIIRDERAGMEAVLSALSTGAEAEFALFHRRKAAVYGEPRYFDEAAASREGLLCFPLRHHQGTTVCFPGDLSLMELRHDRTCRCREAIHRVREWLLTMGVPVRMEGNDLLADGRKVASWAANEQGGYRQTAAHFSIHTEPELIRRVCAKPMKKEPGALAGYGLSAEDIWRSISDLWE